MNSSAFKNTFAVLCRKWWSQAVLILHGTSHYGKVISTKVQLSSQLLEEVDYVLSAEIP